MESIKGFIAIGLTAVMISCGTTKDSTSTIAERERGRNNVENATNVNSRTAQESRVTRVGESANRLAEVEEKMGLQRMYSDLDMTQSQIADFERQWTIVKTSWARENRNQVMNSYERIENQDRILKGILDESRFKAYQQWVRDNAAEE